MQYTFVYMYVKVKFILCVSTHEILEFYSYLVIVYFMHNL